MVYGRVYVIRSSQTTDIYIGSTEKELYERMSGHWRDFKYYLNTDETKYMTSFELLKYEDAFFELIYEGKFENTSALERKEGEYQRSMECVNRNIAGRTSQEWRDENKEKYVYQYTKYNEEERHAESSKVA